MRILIIEDNPGDVRLVQEVLREAGGHFTITSAEKLALGLELLASRDVDVALLDLGLPDSRGLETLTRFQTAFPQLPVVIMTSSADETLAIQAVQLGAQDYLVKGQVDGGLLRRALTYAVERKKFEEALRQAKNELEERVLERTAELVRANELLERDIAERKQAEATVRLQAEQYATMVATTTDGYWLFDTDGNLLDANEAYSRMSGYSREELLRLKVTDIEALETPEETARHIRKVARSGFDRFESTHRKKDGSLLDVEISVSFWPAGRKFLLFARDITARKRAEEDRLRLESAVEQASESVILADPRGVIEYVNPAFEVINGCPREEALGKSYAEFLENDARGNEVREALTQVRQWKGHLNRKRKSGEACRLDVVVSPVMDNSGSILNYLVVERDISQETRLQQHLRQLQKMEALATLAGGIAHDFNNLLSTMVINTEMVLLDLDDNSSARDSLLLALQAAHRGRELVKQIIAFSRQKELERKPMRISPVLKETLKFLRSSLPANIEIREDIVTKADVVLGDPSQIHQILMNLCTNAGYAMRQTGGVLGVKMNAVEVDYAMAATHPDLKPGRYLRLTVSDTGQGMSPEVMERIFDPFFTTKKPGEGTGMGLSVVHGIIKGCGGAITVYSEEGQGSTFNIFLPQLEGEPDLERILPGAIARGKERILLVEDESPQLLSMQNALERLGYQVTARENGRDALSDFQADPKRFDVVITDQTMPKMSGAGLAEAIFEIRPDVPVILCTGFSEVVDGDKAKLKGIREFIMKPLSMKELSEVIRRVLNK